VRDPANGVWVETVGAVAEYVLQTRGSSPASGGER